MARPTMYFFFVAFISLVQVITADYKAAVVEYQPFRASLPNTTVEENLQQYIIKIEQAKSVGDAEIIVFPEYGLTGDVYDPSGYAIEVPGTGAGPNFTDFWLQKLSNAARGHSIYVVVNLIEKTTNKVNKTIYYNTNLVFDKDGKIAAKYRKINLFDEPTLTPGRPDENQVTFTTDFGVTFGIFTCYDLTFNNPSKTILSNANTTVTDIVFPTAWISFLPFYHSLSTQSGYAVANGVNLLAAGLNAPYVGMGGSGIYGADGSVYSYYISGSNTTKLLIASVKNAPKTKYLGGGLKGFNDIDDNVAPLATYNASRLFESEKYIFKTINLSQINITEEVCHKSFCCRFNLIVSSNQINSSDIYKIMAYSGPLTIVTKREDQRICSLLACETQDLSTCGSKNVNVTIKFSRIFVECTTSNINEYYQPFSLTTKLIPAFNTTYNSTVANGVRKVTYFKELEQDNVLAFGILGNSASISMYSTVLLIGVLFFNYVLF